MLARFTSADTITENPYRARRAGTGYSYVGNDPLAYTDPSGHCFLGCFWQHIGSAVSGAVRSIGHFLTHNPIVRAIVQIGLTVALVAVLGPGGALTSLGLSAATAGAAAAFAAGVIVTGLSGGNLGQALKAGAIAGATAFAFFGIGDATNAVAGVDPSAAHIQPDFSTPDAYAFNVAGHALVGCGVAVANGGSCGSGALSGAVTSGAGPLINGQDQVASLVTNSVLGGVASVAGGGKFANGAITGAFGYLFNWLGRREDGLLWAIQPTAGEMAAHYADGTGETVYREGSDVSLADYPSSQFNRPVGTVFYAIPTSGTLFDGLANWEIGTLKPGALTDAFIYGSLNNIQAIGGGYVQLSPDTFNFDMHDGAPWRNFMTWTQQQTLGGGASGKNFQTIFIGPTKAP